jgi:hypothetical protein
MADMVAYDVADPQQCFPDPDEMSHVIEISAADGRG